MEIMSNFGSSKPLLVDGDSHFIGIFTIKV